jgi:hypothetical protein
MLSAEELQAVENWRFEKRMPSRAAAVRELLRRGLTGEGFLQADLGAKSQSFGVLDIGEAGKPNGNKPSGRSPSGPA